MSKKLLLYIVTFIFLSGILLLFNKGYKELSEYNDLIIRHNTAYGLFQDLSRQISNAAILTPELASINRRTGEANLFFTDSNLIISLLNQLKSIVRDSVKVSIIKQLDTIIPQELNWLLASNVTDSIIHNHGTVHTAKLKLIHALIERGIERTRYLIEYRKTLLHRSINTIKIWMTLFILLSGILIIYTGTSLFRQENKTRVKEREVTEYKYALDASSIVAITNQKGIIQHVNDNFCRISKYSREELIGRDHRIINSGYHSKAFIKELWTTIAQGRIWKGELRNKAKDGSIYWVDTTIVPFLDANNKPYQYVAIRSDITERKKAEEQLIKSEKIYKTIASSIPGSVICLIDPDFRYLLIEGDMLEKLGYSKEMLLGKKAADVLSPDVFAGVLEEFKQAFAGITVTRESQRMGYDIISRFIPLKDEDNSVYAIMTVAIDVTELKQAQRDIAELNQDLEDKIIKRTEQLNLANKELENFSYSVSHDLRSPLRIIDGYSQILLEDYAPQLDAEGQQTIQVIMRNTKKMGQLIDDLLDFSRSGKKEMKLTRVNMNALVEEVLEELRSAGVPVPAALHCRPLQEAWGDSSLLRQVWINLLSNAVKYSANREKPEVEIGMQEQGKEQVYYVKDNGAGFDMKYAGKLFGVFQRLHRQDQFSGTGVGLALVQRIIIRHGGRVWAEAKEDAGACFYFTLPARSGE